MAPRQDRRSERGATPAREEAIEVVYSRRAVSDLERLQTLLAERDTRAAATALLRISEVIAILRSHPLIGRPVEHGMRELVISYGRSGYIALYDLERGVSRVIVHAIRHQKEAGYRALDIGRPGTP